MPSKYCQKSDITMAALKTSHSSPIKWHVAHYFRVSTINSLLLVIEIKGTLQKKTPLRSKMKNMDKLSIRRREGEDRK